MKIILCLLLVYILLPAQTADMNPVVQAREAWNKAARLGNEWAANHNELVYDKHDVKAFHKYLEAEREMEKAFKAIGY